MVDIDDISTKIIRYLTIDKGGRVTFIPLNCVWPPHLNYPIRPNVVPLLKKLKFNLKFGPTFVQVWSTWFLYYYYYFYTINFFSFFPNEVKFSKEDDIMIVLSNILDACTTNIEILSCVFPCN